jgi:hypothetical protein
MVDLLGTILAKRNGTGRNAAVPAAVIIDPLPSPGGTVTEPLGLLIAAFHNGGCAEDEFNDWYDTEHIPDRQRVPGFLTLHRWVGTDDARIALALYDLQSLAILQSPQYEAIGYRNPSPWTRRIMPKCRRVLRFTGEQIVPGNVLAPCQAGGLLCMGFNLETGYETEYADWMDREHLPNLARVPGVLSARRFIAAESSHRFMAVYHLAAPEVCDSPAWRDARETPSTHKMRTHTRDRLRIVCRPYRPIAAADSGGH